MRISLNAMFCAGCDGRCTPITRMLRLLPSSSMLLAARLVIPRVFPTVLLCLAAAILRGPIDARSSAGGSLLCPQAGCHGSGPALPVVRRGMLTRDATWEWRCARRYSMLGASSEQTRLPLSLFALLLEGVMPTCHWCLQLLPACAPAFVAALPNLEQSTH